MKRIHFIKNPMLISLPAALIVAVLGAFQPAYRYIDNYFMSIISSGALNRDTINPYLNPFLSQIIAGLNRLVPTADWFTILGRLFLTLGIWWIGIILVRRIGVNRKWVLYEIVFVSVYLGCSFYNINYTVQAAVFASIGSLTLQLNLYDGGNRGEIGVGTFFWGLGICWRAEGALLVIPFALLTAVINLISKKEKTSLRHIAMVLTPAVLVLVLLSMYKTVVFSSPRYAEALQYNDARMALVDYPVKDWEEIKDYLSSIGVTKNDYTSMCNRILADVDHINAESINQIVKEARTSRFPLTIKGVLYATGYAVNAVLHSKGSLYLGALIFLGIISIIFSRPNKENILVVALAIMGTAIILIFFSWLGRIPGRVIESGLLALGSSIIFEDVICHKFYSAKKVDKVLFGIFAVAISCIGLFGYISYPHGTMQNLFSITQNTSASEWANTDDYTEELYFWSSPLFIQQCMDQFWEKGFLANSQFLSHNFPISGIQDGQPNLLEHLREINAANPMEALLNRPKTYLVAEQPEIGYVLTYLKEHFDSSVDVVKVGTFFGYSVWQFESIVEFS